MVVTPEEVVKLVLQHKIRSVQLRIYRTPFQKWTFVGALITLSIGVVSGLAFRVWRVDFLAWTALGSLLCAMAASSLYQVAHMVPELAKLKNIEREASGSMVADFNADMDLIQQLTLFEQHHLTYAKSKFLSQAKHIRERCGLLAGALDKVGILPMGVTAYFSYAKAVKEGVTFGPVEWAAVALVALVLLAVRMISTAQWMESVAELYEHAIAVRQIRSGRK